MNDTVQIVEVGPRDGFQPIGPFIPTQRKLHFLRELVICGLRDVEIGSFVSAKAVPQLADTPALLAASKAMAGLRPRVLVPTVGQGMRAIAAGAPCIAFVLSVSEAHNRSNVRRAPLQSVAEYRELAAALPSGTDMRLNLATAFDCPFEGRVAIAATMDVLAATVGISPGAEICLCDTTGRADPRHVGALFREAMAQFGAGLRWAFHGHDTYGLGLANVVAALGQGVRIFDASLGGLGGCPFAPGATGNVATEDLVYLFERMGIATGCDHERLVSLACEAEAIPGAQPGGRVRQVLAARSACNLAQP